MKVKKLMVVLKGIFSSFDDCEIISLNQHYAQGEGSNIEVDYETLQIFIEGNTIDVIVDKDANILNLDEVIEKKKQLTIC